ncbi:hypothetical protein SAMD00019534_046140 [Acytostelium subglobosum LB1]|uniref:hypothetical protein n=1 Tax=Acytostelium subglobosum LB1 TaxID=1410327 RepID=UPI0006447CA5|nr:hypothetical protein SAMD00019534_046140 [Acytostelium subglobosum LB1]GAM21439.1 hypothetical protein SAMD00019534_046140 [Acytostelium subglobosum LB1]|eukprot:XP_012755558.1 hypothetical protein SAMD00019534_046140 [Acytostelium subglobosum LB1]
MTDKRVEVVDDDEEEYQFIPFSKRVDWKDVQPIEQDDGPNPICPIAYKEEFKEKMNYFRAIIRSQEKTKRVLDLIEAIIEDNPSNYTVWYYRREVLAKIEFDIDEEFDFVGTMGEADPKNYQIWNHRRYLVETYHDCTRELEFVAERLHDDAKNYHAWAHRQWVIQTFNLWEQELPFVESLLKLDHRNNSAWNQRFFVIEHQHKLPLPAAVIAKETQYALSFIRMSPNNESPWSYLRGLFKGQSLLQSPELMETLLELKGKYIGCPHVLSLLIDMYEEQNTRDSLTAALALCTSLQNTVDQIHHNYWQYKHGKLMSKQSSLDIKV